MKDRRIAYFVGLPADSHLPRQCRTLTIAIHSFPRWSRQPFEPKCISLETSDDRRIWTSRITGHQHLLFLWGLAAEACENVTFMLQHRKAAPAELWLRRANRLLLGSAAAVAIVRNLDSQYFEHFSRSEMAELKMPDMRSSNEYRMAKESIRQMELAMTANQGPCRAVSCELADARSSFEEARGTLLSQQCIQTLKVSSNAEVISGEDYDREVGVLRTPKMFIEDYSFYLSHAIADAQNDLHRKSAEQGDKLMVAIVGELLDPPTYRPNA